MKSVIVCPECKKLVYFNSYFGAYICDNCGWEDASYAQKRDSCVVVTGSQIVFKVSGLSGSMANKKCGSRSWKRQPVQKGKASVR